MGGRRIKRTNVADSPLPGWTKIQLGTSLLRGDVSRLWAGTVLMRVGSAVVKTGGIAGVSTDPKHRLQGYSRLVMEEAHRFLLETGHELSLLFGLPGIYDRFGYAPVLAETTTTVTTADARAALTALSAGRGTSRPLRETDWPAVLDLYHSSTQRRSGSIVRPVESWQGYRYGTEWDCGTRTVIVQAGREILAFATFDDAPDRCRVADLGFKDRNAFTALLETITCRAEEDGLADFELKLPVDHAFVVFCRRCGASVRTAYERNAGGMARILALRPLMESLSELLVARLRASTCADRKGVLELRTDAESIALELPDGRLRSPEPGEPGRLVSLPQSRLVQLVMGYRGIEDIAAEDDVEVAPEALAIVDALFPVGHPWIAMPDRF